MRISNIGLSLGRASLGCAVPVLLLAVSTLPASAALVTYNGFSNTAGLSFSGNATTAVTGDGTVARIIPALGNQGGAIYSTAGFTLGNNATFSTQFQFRMTNPGGVDPADGFTFVLTASPSGLGTVGYGMGYQGVNNSVAIEFDTYNNGNANSLGFFAQEPNSSNHVSLDLGGVLTNTAATNVYGNGSCGFTNGTPAQNNYAVPGCMSNGDLWTANISYDGALLNVSLSDPLEGSTFFALTNYAINISSYLGTNSAFVGFTGSSGAGWENEDIVNWSYANTTQLANPPTDVPEPVTLSLFGAGALAAFAGRRKLRRPASKA